jgi:asparagine synthase (glutamine-hydrolysing)
MCGILGCVNFSNQKIDKSKFEDCLDLMKHRGPDNQNSIYFNNDTVALGHRRLSVIDLTNNANQPMLYDKYCIVFNGEIYNYLEIRNDLISKGFVFNTDSDTEVILKSYEFYGEKCVNIFNGMWSFVIYDISNNTFFCSRDRFGVKPFNYYYSRDFFIFSSEIKSILKYDSSLNIPNYNSIGLYCLEGASSELNETWFTDIYRLPPGHNIIIKGNQIEIIKYYNYPSNKVKIDLNNAMSKFKNLFIDAVKLRMRSDVPIGVTLSGGLDSTSIISALSELSIKNINSYTASFTNYKFDEFKTANETNKIYDLIGHKVTIDYNDDEYIPLLKKMIFHLESGNLSPSIFPLWKIYEEAKKKVTVVLEGQGADELLAGYVTTFSGHYLLELLKTFKFKTFIIECYKLNRNYSFKETILLFFRTFLNFKNRSFVRKIFFKYDNVLSPVFSKIKYNESVTPKSQLSLTSALQQSHRTTLVNLLHYGDAISMAFSIENRLPFLDYRLVDYIMTLPSSYLISNGKGKFLLRESLKSILPDYVYKDSKKLGFPSPINKFFLENKHIIRSILLSKKCVSRKLFNTKELEQIINSDLEKNIQSTRFLFRLISVELWFQTFIDKNLQNEY